MRTSVLNQDFAMLDSALSQDLLFVVLMQVCLKQCNCIC